MNQSQDQQSDHSNITKWLTWALVIALLVAAGIIAYLTYVVVRDIVVSWELTSLPGVAIKEATSTPDEFGVIADEKTPLQPADGPEPEPWDGASRVSMLVMGLDYRDWEAGEGAPRTDTMILLTIDPLARTAGMISIPRDMWVNIPGFEYGRINTAYSLGEAYQLPGGGPGLAMDSVEELLGVPIDYYALIDFGTFIRFIDEIGGIIYPGVKEFLPLLQKKYKLFIVSNCPEFTIKHFMKFTGIDDLILDTLSHGQNYKAKHENISTLITNYKLKRPIYIGDTHSDMIQSRKAGVPFVFMSYGFGQCEGFDQSFDSFKDFAKYYLNA
jgi:hypothetical protein